MIVMEVGPPPRKFYCLQLIRFLVLTHFYLFAYSAIARQQVEARGHTGYLTLGTYSPPMGPLAKTEGNCELNEAASSESAFPAGVHQD